MNKAEIFNRVVRRINSIKEIIQKRNWILKQDLIIEEPATEADIKEVELKLGINIPEDYKDLFKFSKHLEFRYQFDEETPAEFRGNFSGEVYWNLNRFNEQFNHLKEWIEGAMDPAYNDPEAIEITKRVSTNKFPMINVANGDLIVVGNNPSEVIYLSHEGDTMHGKKLGNNLWEFLEFHSKIGFAGSEDWQFEPFYNFKEDKMETESSKVDKFIEWFQK